MRNLTRRLIIAMLLGVLVYGGLVLYRGTSDIAQRFGSYQWWTFAGACALAFGNYLCRFMKWEYYLEKLEIRGIPKGESLLTFLSGFVLTVTPGKVGEVFKSLILKETRGIPVVQTAPIIVAERVTDLIGIIALIAIGSTAFTGGMVWASSGAAVVLAILVFIASPGLSNGFADLLERLPGALGRIGARIAPKLREALSRLRLLTTPRRLVWPTLLSIVGWSMEGVALWLILKGFGHDTSVAMSGFFYATATLAGALIPVPGGLGVTEGVLEAGLSQLGNVPSSIATSAMLLVRFATLWFAVAVGFAALGLLRLRYPGLMSADKELASAATKSDSDPRKDASGAG